LPLQSVLAGGDAQFAAEYHVQSLDGAEADSAGDRGERAVARSNPGTEGLGKKVAEAQLAIADAKKYPKFQGNVRAVDTRGLWREAADSPTNQGYHYNHNAETYMETGLRLGWAMADLLKGEKK